MAVKMKRNHFFQTKNPIERIRYTENRIFRTKQTVREWNNKTCRYQI